MTATTVNITGAFNKPDATWPAYTKAEFYLSGYDTDGDVISPTPVSVILGANGELDVDLWPNENGVRGTVYRVLVNTYSDDSYSRITNTIDFGRIQVTDAADISDLLDTPTGVGGSWYSTISEAEYNAAIQAAADAEAAAAIATGAAIAFSARNAPNATIIAGLANGSVGIMGGIAYLVDSTATGSGSCTNDLSVDGLVPHGPVTPQHFGAVADGVTDDTAKFNAMFAYIRSLVAANVVRETASFKPGVYRCNGEINATGLRAFNLLIKGNGAIIESHATGGIALDMLYSRFVRVENLAINCPDSVNKVAIGIQIGRKDGTSSDCQSFVNVETHGHFSFTGLYNYGAETVTYDHCRFWNNDSSLSSWAVVMDGIDHFGVSSNFQTVASVGPVSFNENVFISLDARKQGGGPCLWMGRTARHRYIGCYLVSFDDATIDIFSDSFGHVDLDLDVHCETAQSPGLETCVRFIGAANTVMKGFRFRDHNPHASGQIFKSDVTTVQLLNAEIDIPSFFATPTNGVFNPKAHFTVQGTVKVLDGSALTNVAKQTGWIFTDDKDLATYGPGSYIIESGADNSLTLKGRLLVGGSMSASVSPGALTETAYMGDTGFFNGVHQAGIMALTTPTVITTAPAGVINATQSIHTLNVSGGATITDITWSGGSGLGMVFLLLMVQNATTYTLVHDISKLRLQGGANKTIGQYETILLVRNGTNLWQEFSGISSATSAAKANVAGQTFTGPVVTPAATTGAAGLRLPHGTAPTSPVDGEMWTTTAGLFVRINGVTVGPLS